MPSRIFQACARRAISPSENCARFLFFHVKKIFVRRRLRAFFPVFRGENRAAIFFPRKKTRREARPELSTKKVTENLQKPSVFYLTEPKAIPISCGQGSGHPHPVVVDNVSGSFGNLSSPESFCRL
jgi:hypothetical protein